MKVNELPKPVREMLGYYEALRRLGFEAADIFAFRYDLTVGIELHAQEKIFVCVCGEIDSGKDEFSDLWADVVEAYNSRDFDDKELLVNYKESQAYTGAERLVSALMNRGFFLPEPRKEAAIALRRMGSAMAKV